MFLKSLPKTGSFYNGFLIKSRLIADKHR